MRMIANGKAFSIIRAHLRDSRANSLRAVRKIYPVSSHHPAFRAPPQAGDEQVVLTCM